MMYRIYLDASESIAETRIPVWMYLPLNDDGESVSEWIQGFMLPALKLVKYHSSQPHRYDDGTTFPYTYKVLIDRNAPGVFRCINGKIYSPVAFYDSDNDVREAQSAVAEPSRIGSR